MSSLDIVQNVGTDDETTVSVSAGYMQGSPTPVVLDATPTVVSIESGIVGAKGDPGEMLYTWVKFADTPTTGMNDSPIGKLCIGIAYNKVEPTPSTNYADYQWQPLFDVSQVLSAMGIMDFKSNGLGVAFGKTSELNGFEVAMDANFTGLLAKSGNTVWHAGNDGHNSGLDADTVDGYQATAAATPTTVAVRDSEGDISTRQFRSTQTNQSAISGAMAFRVNTTDNYIRFCNDLEAIRTFLGVDPKIVQGSNANGRYVKYPDGTMICHHKKSSGVGAVLSTEHISISPPVSWTFPEPFYSAPDIFLSNNKILVSGSSNPISVSRSASSAIGTSSVDGIFVWYDVASATVETEVSLLAIGRWK